MDFLSKGTKHLKANTLPFLQRRAGKYGIPHSAVHGCSSGTDAHLYAPLVQVLLHLPPALDVKGTQHEVPAEQKVHLAADAAEDAGELAGNVPGG